MIKKTRWALEKCNSFRLEIFNSFNFRGKKTMFPNIRGFAAGGFLLTACVVEFGGVLIYTFPWEFRVCGEMNSDQNKRRIFVSLATPSCKFLCCQKTTVNSIFFGCSCISCIPLPIELSPKSITWDVLRI